MDKVMFIELGMGADLHGQNITKAALRAIRNAIGHNSMPGMRSLVADDPARMKVNVRLAVPIDREKLDLGQLREALPYGEVTFEVVEGGMLTSSGVFLADKGDRNDLIYIVNAAVEVGL